MAKFQFNKKRFIFTLMALLGSGSIVYFSFSGCSRAAVARNTKLFNPNVIQTNSVSVAVTGLPDSAPASAAVELVLQNNNADDLKITANGVYWFKTKLINGGAYKVTVLTNPTDYTCTVYDGKGVAHNRDVTDIGVDCVPVSQGG